MKLTCPKCSQLLFKKDNSYKCINNHSFDISSSGYINLLLSKTLSGDNKEMIIARESFLIKGFYDFLLDKIASLIPQYSIDIIDCGCGEGYYTNQLSEKTNKFIIGMDISKDAIKKASRKNKNNLFIVANSYHIPLENNSIDVIINNCAPHVNDEFNRIIKKDGIIIKVIPGKNHLIELKDKLYEKVYYNDICIKDFDSFELFETYEVTTKAKLNNEDLKNLVMMTPYYYKTSKEKLNEFFLIKELFMTFDFVINVYRVKYDDD